MTASRNTKRAIPPSARRIYAVTIFFVMGARPPGSVNPHSTLTPYGRRPAPANRLVIQRERLLGMTCRVLWDKPSTAKRSSTLNSNTTRNPDKPDRYPCTRKKARQLDYHRLSQAFLLTMSSAVT